MRVPYSQLFETLERALLNEGFEHDRAGRCAELFAESSRDGVYSHGLNRFPLLLSLKKFIPVGTRKLANSSKRSIGSRIIHSEGVGAFLIFAPVHYNDHRQQNCVQQAVYRGKHVKTYGDLNIAKEEYWYSRSQR